MTTTNIMSIGAIVLSLFIFLLVYYPEDIPSYNKAEILAANPLPTTEPVYYDTTVSHEDDTKSCWGTGVFKIEAIYAHRMDSNGGIQHFIKRWREEKQKCVREGYDGKPYYWKRWATVDDNWIE